MAIRKVRLFPIVLKVAALVLFVVAGATQAEELSPEALSACLNGKFADTDKDRRFIGFPHEKPAMAREAAEKLISEGDRRVLDAMLKAVCTKWHLADKSRVLDDIGMTVQARKTISGGEPYRVRLIESIATLAQQPGSSAWQGRYEYRRLGLEQRRWAVQFEIAPSAERCVSSVAVEGYLGLPLNNVTWFSWVPRIQEDRHGEYGRASLDSLAPGLPIMVMEYRSGCLRNFFMRDEYLLKEVDDAEAQKAVEIKR